jgi:hypothetical protein
MYIYQHSRNADKTRFCFPLTAIRRGRYRALQKRKRCRCVLGAQFGGVQVGLLINVIVGGVIATFLAIENGINDHGC